MEVEGEIELFNQDSLIRDQMEEPLHMISSILLFSLGSLIIQEIILLMFLM